MRVLGVDWGERRIGLALSDPTGTIASPLTTLTYRARKRPPLRDLERIAREHGAEAIVIGLPLTLAGEESERCGDVRRAGETLAGRLGVPVDYIDERLTSVRAKRVIHSLDLPKSERERKGRVDAVAAALILQGWLDRKSRQ